MDDVPTLEDLPPSYLEFLDAGALGRLGLRTRRKVAFGVTFEAVATIARARECDVRDASMHDAPTAALDVRAGRRRVPLPSRVGRGQESHAEDHRTSLHQLNR